MKVTTAVREITSGTHQASSEMILKDAWEGKLLQTTRWWGEGPNQLIGGATYVLEHVANSATSETLLNTTSNIGLDQAFTSNIGFSHS